MANSTRPHTLDLVDEILAGTLPQEQARRVLNTYDPKSLNPIGFAALSAARDVHSLLALKTLLDPATEQEQGQTQQMLLLLEQVAASQARQEESQARMEQSQARQEHLLRQIACALGGKPKSSPRPQAAARTGSAR